MDQFAVTLLSFPPDGDDVSDSLYDKSARAHVQKLSQLVKEQSSLVASSAVDLLQHLDPSRHSISFLALLQAIFASPSESSIPLEDLRAHVVTFLYTFDARQIRYAGAAFSGLLACLEPGEVFPASVAVQALGTALLRLDPSGSMFTSYHLPLVRLAYETGNIEHVLKVINKNIVFYPGARGRNELRLLCDERLPAPSYITLESGLTDSVTTTTVLEYDLLCGLCHLSRRDWQAAFDALQRVVAYPTKEPGCSNIMVEACAKWILVGLLLQGKTPTVPRTVSQTVQKNYASLAAAYFKIGAAFEDVTTGAQTLKNEIEGAGQLFWADGGNLGLVREVVVHYQRWQIVGLRNVYSEIGLEEIRACTQSARTGRELESAAEVEALVRDMIDNGMLGGVIEKPSDGSSVAGDGRGHLVFLAPATELSEARFAAEIEASAQKMKRLAPVVQATRERLATSREYIRQLVREQKREKESARDPAIGFDAQVEDEDLMTDAFVSR